MLHVYRHAGRMLACFPEPPEPPPRTTHHASCVTHHAPRTTHHAPRKAHRTSCTRHDAPRTRVSCLVRPSRLPTLHDTPQQQHQAPNTAATSRSAPHTRGTAVTVTNTEQRDREATQTDRDRGMPAAAPPPCVSWAVATAKRQMASTQKSERGLIMCGPARAGIFLRKKSNRDLSRALRGRHIGTAPGGR